MVLNNETTSSKIRPVIKVLLHNEGTSHRSLYPKTANYFMKTTSSLNFSKPGIQRLFGTDFLKTGPKQRLKLK